MFAALDLDGFPGFATMRALRSLGFAVTGYYLVGPSHPNVGWLGQRAELVRFGFGLAPIFVGQQVVRPGSHTVTATQGRIDGGAAVAQLRNNGFPPGSSVYLDIENGPPYGALECGYIEAWADVVASGGFNPSIYCSHLVAAQAAALLPASGRLWPWKVEKIGGTQQPPWPLPPIEESGYPGAALWQRAQDVSIMVNGEWLEVDLDVSVLADPSAP